MKITEKLKSNKGFTMVELIIVIAIIAILAAVIAPQYLRFVEDARRSNDLQVANAYMDAAMVAVSDLSGRHSLSNDWYTFKWGYTTDERGNMNMHISPSEVDENNMPINYTGARDYELQVEIALMMGWLSQEEKDIINIDTAKTLEIPRPQSSSVQEESFLFHLNTRTGEILIHKDSPSWVNDIGVNEPLAE